MSIEPDDLRSHRNLGADLKKEAAKLALWDELVTSLDYLVFTDQFQPGYHTELVKAAQVLIRAKDIK